MLQANGTSIVQVAAELAECCRGKKVLCGEHDQHWLTTLFAAAGRNVPILIGDFDSFVSKLAQDVGRSADQLIANPDRDFSKNHRALTDDVWGRRFNRAAPDRSVMLMKPSGEAPHVGGVLTRPGEPYYELIRSWIAAVGFSSYVSSVSIDVFRHPPISSTPDVSCRQ